MKQRVLFLCTHNSARSQMAEGLLRSIYGDRYEAHSAGTAPTRLNPLTVQVMAEIGIDISEHRSKGIEEFKRDVFDIVVTVCDDARESCPYFPGKRVIHRGFQDPITLKDLRAVRDEMRAWLIEAFK
ncbi:MAG: arsenate reductase ArsC [Candidatus Thermoplasmatota archaeon]